MMTKTEASSAFPLLFGLNRAMSLLSDRSHVVLPLGVWTGFQVWPSFVAARMVLMSAWARFALTGLLVLRAKTSIAEWTPSK
jgi:hypothetical protein